MHLNHSEHDHHGTKACPQPHVMLQIITIWHALDEVSKLMLKELRPPASAWHVPAWALLKAILICPDASRNTAQPLAEHAAHSHWVWQASFNPAHDSLLLTSSSDALVDLWFLPSLGESGTQDMVSYPHGASLRADLLLLLLDTCHPDDCSGHNLLAADDSKQRKWSAAQSASCGELRQMSLQECSDTGHRLGKAAWTLCMSAWLTAFHGLMQACKDR